MVELYICLGVLFFIIFWLIPCFLSRELQRLKGYDGGFLICFFLGIVGLIYSAGLPDKTNKVIQTTDEGEKVIVHEEPEEYKDETVLNNTQAAETFTICSNCGWQVFDDEECCSNCGTARK